MDVFKKKSQDNTVCIMQANAQITNLTIQRRLANAHRLARGGERGDGCDRQEDGGVFGGWIISHSSILALNLCVFDLTRPTPTLSH